MFAFCTETDSTPGAFHPVMVRGMDNAIIFKNGQTKARFQGRLGKSIVEEKEMEKVVRDEDEQDNALKASMSLFPFPFFPFFPPQKERQQRKQR